MRSHQLAVLAVGVSWSAPAWSQAYDEHLAPSRTLPQSHLWEEREADEDPYSASVDARGWHDRRRSRPGLELQPHGYDALPRSLPIGDNRLRLHLSDEFAVGPMYADNVDPAELTRAYPASVSERLVGNEGSYFNKVRAEVEGPLGTPRLRGYFELIDQREARSYLGAERDEVSSRPRYTGNLVWDVDERFRLTLGARYDLIDVSSAGLSSYYLSSASRELRYDEVSVVASARHQVASNVEWALVLDLSRERHDARAAAGLTVPAHDNIDTQEVWGNYPFTTRERSTEVFVDARIRSFVDDILGGDAHTFTLGAQVEHRMHDTDETRNGGFTYVDYAATDASGALVRHVDEDDRGTWELFSSDRGDEVHGKLAITSVAGYLEDEWKLGSRFVMVPGVRFEHFRAGFRDGPSVWSSNTWAPRLAASWDVTEGASTRVFGTLGRHYQALTPAVVLRAADGAAYSPLSYWDWTGDPFATPAPGKDDPGWQRAAQFPALMGSLDDVRHPYADRAVAGISQRVEALALDMILRYEYRRFGDMLAIVDGAASVYDPESNPSGTYDVVEYGSTLPGARDRTSYYALRAGEQPDYRVVNPRDAKRSYHSVRFELDEDFTRWLTVRGSVTWTLDRGNLDAMRGISTEWRDPNGKINAYGPMAGHDAWRVKLETIVDLPFDMRAYVDYAFHSGEYYTRYFRIVPANGPRTYVNDDRGRGGYRYPHRHLLDARLQGKLPLGAPGTTTLWVQVFNLLNASTVTGFREQSTSFRRVTRIEKPREVHVGARYEY